MFTNPHIRAKWIYFLRLRSVLFFTILTYIVVYLAIPATPGNSPSIHPSGWWGWFDQGKYLLSANAFVQLDFSPDKHFYPPLYPALGAIFLKWSSGHLFFLINLAALTWFSYVFIRFADRYIPRWGSIALLFSTTIFNYTLFVNYLIPWTSTLSVALLSSGILGLVWLDEVKTGIRKNLSGWHVFFVAICLGLIVPTRPADAVIGGAIGLCLLLSYWRTSRELFQHLPRISIFLALVLAGSIIGPLFYLSFNLLVFNAPFGSYIQVAGSNGYFPADLAEKFYSIWLDGFTIYGESNAGLTDRYPWLFLSLGGLVWVIMRGDSLLRSVALSIALLFVLYMPYGDLLPNGLWRYLNIHYFKWTFPFLALFALLLIKQTWFTWQEGKGRFFNSTFLFIIPLFLMSVHLVLDVTPVTIRSNINQSNISFDLSNKKIDFIDFKGLSGGFTEVYLGSHRLILDGKELTRVRDYRLLPMSWGVRLLLIRPTDGSYMEFFPDQRLTRTNGPLSAQIGSYRFVMGKLKPFREFTQQEITKDYKLGELIDFSQQGSGTLYATRGWSGPESWGRWSVNDEATIQIRLAEPSNHALSLDLVMGAFVSESYPCQEVSIILNDKKIAHQSLCLGKGGEQQRPYKFDLPQEFLRSDGKIDIRLMTPDSISPKKLGISVDDRVLGIGISSIALTTRKH
jgi:hypothetical protein